jgi:hypothetical protein
MTSNNSEEKLDTMTEAPNESYQQQNDRINQLQIFFSFSTLTHKGKITEISTRIDCLKLMLNENMQH